MASAGRGHSDEWLHLDSLSRKRLVKYQRVIRPAGELLGKMPPELREILELCGTLAARCAERVFLVGGIIRDLLLDKNNPGINTSDKNNPGINTLDKNNPEINTLDKNNLEINNFHEDDLDRNKLDIDLVYTGEPEPFLEELSSLIAGEWTANLSFGTGSLELSGGYKIDLAVPRRERYVLPGALPEVKPAGSEGLAVDVFRRDFTVNGLLLEIMPDAGGRLIDFFQGEKDLNEGLLRVFHEQSFQDDPTRIIRGVRLASRRGLVLEKRTEGLLREALEREYPALSSFRVLKEFELLFQEEVTGRLYGFLASFPILNLLNTDGNQLETMEKVRRLEDCLEYFRKKNYNIKEWLLRLAVIIPEVKPELLESWELPAEEKAVLAFRHSKDELTAALSRNLHPYALTGCLAGLGVEQLILLMVDSRDKQLERNMDYYLTELAGIELEINGRDLLREGFSTGPRLGKILELVYAARLEGLVKGRKQELEYARRLKAERDWSDT